MSITVFLSYARVDLAVMDPLRGSLEDAGFHVTVDQKEILPGEDWRKRLRDMIVQADVVLFLISNASLQSADCAWEVETALKYGKRLMPIVIEDGIAAPVPQAITALNFVLMRSEAERRENLSSLMEGLRLNHEWVRYQTALMVRAVSWQDRGRAEDDLLRGTPLAEAQDHVFNLPKDAPPPAEHVRRYIHASATAEQRRKDDELRQAEDRTDNERRLRRAADARRLSTEARLVADARPDLAALLALEAWGADQNDTTHAALLGIAMKWPRLLQFAVGTSSAPPTGATSSNRNRMSLSRDGRFILMAASPENKSIRVIETGAPPKTVMAFDVSRPIVATALDLEHGVLLLLENDSTLNVVRMNRDPLDVDAFRTLDSTDTQDCDAMIHCGGSLIAIGTGPRVTLFDYLARQVLWSVIVPDLRITLSLQTHGPDWIIATGFPHRGGNEKRSISLRLTDGEIQKAYGLEVRSLNHGQAVLMLLDSGELAYAEEAALDRQTPVPAPNLKDKSWALSVNGKELAFASLRSVDFAMAMTKGGFGKVKFWGATEPDPAHNGYVNHVSALPDHFGAGFASFGKDGSAAIWSAEPNALLVHRLRDLGAGGEPAFSQDGRHLCSFGTRGYVIRATDTWEAVAQGEEELVAFADLEARPVGILKTGGAIWLDTKEQILALPPFKSGRGAAHLVVAEQEDGTILHIDLIQQSQRAVAQITLPKGSSQWLEVDPLRNALGYVSGKQSLTIHDLTDDTARQITTERGFYVKSFKFLRETGDIALSSGERTKVFAREDFAILYDYGTGSSIGTPMMADALAGQGFLVLLEELGGRLLFVDRDYRSVQAQLRLPTSDYIYQMRASPTEPLLVLTGRAGTAVLDLRPERLEERLRVLANRKLTPSEREQFGVADGQRTIAAPL